MGLNVRRRQHIMDRSGTPGFRRDVPVVGARPMIPGKITVAWSRFFRHNQDLGHSTRTSVFSSGHASADGGVIRHGKMSNSCQPGDSNSCRTGIRFKKPRRTRGRSVTLTESRHEKACTETLAHRPYASHRAGHTGLHIEPIDAHTVYSAANDATIDALVAVAAKTIGAGAKIERRFGIQ